MRQRFVPFVALPRIEREALCDNPFPDSRPRRLAPWASKDPSSWVPIWPPAVVVYTVRRTRCDRSASQSVWGTSVQSHLRASTVDLTFSGERRLCVTTSPPICCDYLGRDTLSALTLGIRASAPIHIPLVERT